MESPKPYREKRPWGEFVEFTKNIPSTVKIISVMPGQALSLQYHHKRDEFWHVLGGNGSIQIGDKLFTAEPGSNHFAPRETDHRMIGGTEMLSILEISFGEFDENDIVRKEDRYGRS